MANTCPICSGPLLAGATCPECQSDAAPEDTTPPSGEPPPSVFDRPTVVPTEFLSGPDADLAAIPPVPEYEYLRIVGRGGMGIVVEARQVSLGRTVAVKILDPRLAGRPGFAARFEREASVLARLNHPNVLRIIDRGLAGSVHYIVTEFVDPPPGAQSADLRKVLDLRRPAPETARSIILQVCQALGYAHAQGVVHRDIKPSNILIDSHGIAKVADFGIAALNDGNDAQQLTQPGTAIGTFGYMAPEQRRTAEAVDRRADVYSTGVVLYEMLTGDMPAGACPPPSQLVPDLPIGWDRIVGKALDPRPECRHADMAELQAAIESVSVTAAAVSPSTCPACGGPTTPADRYCTCCRQALHILCPACHAGAPAGTRFCPSCGLDLPAYLAYADRLDTARRLLRQAAREGTSAADGASDAEAAARAASEALQLIPDDPQAAAVVRNARGVAGRRLAQLLQEALSVKRYSDAESLCERMRRVAPDNSQVASRLLDIQRLRVAGMEEVQQLLGTGEFGRAARRIERLRKWFAGDQTVEALCEAGERCLGLFDNAVKVRLPALRNERRFIEAQRLLEELRATGAHPALLDGALRQAQALIARADEGTAGARRCLDAGQLREAESRAAEVLKIVSDHAGAKEIHHLARLQTQTVLAAEGQTADAVAAGRWFRALDIIDALHGLNGVKCRPGLIRAAGRGSRRANNFARMAVWLLAGLGTIALADALARLSGWGVAGRLTAMDVGRLVQRESLSAAGSAFAFPATCVLALASLQSLVLRRIVVGLSATRLIVSLLAVGQNLLCLEAVADGFVRELLTSWARTGDGPGPALVAVAEHAVVIISTGVLGAVLGGVFGGMTFEIIEGDDNVTRPRLAPVLAGLVGSVAVLLAFGAPKVLVPWLPMTFGLCGTVAAFGHSQRLSRFPVTVFAMCLGVPLLDGASLLQGGAVMYLAVAAAVVIVVGAVWLTAPAERRGWRSLATGAVIAGATGATYWLIAGNPRLLLATTVWLLVVGTLVACCGGSFDYRWHMIDRLTRAIRRRPRALVFPLPAVGTSEGLAATSTSASDTP